MAKVIQKASIKQKLNFLLLFFSIVVTAFIYFPSLENELTNWDDPQYISENETIKDFAAEKIRYHFSHFHMSNYHPLTMISLIMDYKEPLSVKSFRTTNLILHLLNTALVFFFVFSLTTNNKIAFISALLFALHPMHVESVAWASERKDVLYTFFFLAALCTYLKYISDEHKRAKWYLLTTILFVCSLLSKGQAVVLPVILLLMDYFCGRKITLKVIKEKIPWLILSLIFGIVAIWAQSASNSILSNEHTSFIDRILFAGYGIAAYLYKLVLPYNLSGFYSYPVKSGITYPPLFYIAPLLLLALAFIVWKFFRSNKYVILACLFFLISISIVIQLVPVGGAIMADRYTYIPYLGFFILIGKVFADAYEKKFSGLSRSIAITLIPLALIVFAYLTSKRIDVWKDSVTLWSDAISKNQTSEFVFGNRGLAYLYGKPPQYDLAIADFNRALELEPNHVLDHYGRGLAFFHQKNYDKAIADYDATIVADPRFAIAWYNRARTYSAIGKFKEAENDVVEAERLGYPVDPEFIKHLKLKLKQSDLAIADFNKAVGLNPNSEKPYYNRGLAYLKGKQYDLAIADFNKALDLTANDPKTFFHRGLAFFDQGNYGKAIVDYDAAIDIDPGFAIAWYHRAGTYYTIGKFKEALNDAVEAKKLGFPVKPGFIEELQHQLKQK